MIWSDVPAVSKNEAVTKFGFVRTNASATYSKGLSGAVIVEQTVDSAMDVGDGTGDRLAWGGAFVRMAKEPSTAFSHDVDVDVGGVKWIVHRGWRESP